jgi:hypothetical protein
VIKKLLVVLPLLLAGALMLPAYAVPIIDFNSHPDDFGTPIFDSGFQFDFLAAGWGVFGPSSGACCNVDYNGTTSMFADGDRNGGNASILMTAVGGGTFNISALDASVYWIGASGSILLTGQISGGGSVTQTLNVGTPWASFSLSGFNNLSSLTFQDTTSGAFLVAPGMGIDNMNVSTGSSTPEPGTFVMFGSGVIGLAGMLRRKLMR